MQIQTFFENSAKFELNFIIIFVKMRHFRVQSKEQDEAQENKLNFDQKLSKSLKSIVKLLPFVQFTVNYGFAIENVWVTMMMITHGNPNFLDSFVWIIPIIIAIILRPYLARFIHSINYKVYRQISIVSFCLVSAAFGCYLVGLSCGLNKKTQFFRRLLQCSVGWTIMDVAFEFCQYLTQKIETSYNELQKKQQINGSEVKIQDTSKKTNFQFYGLFLGYIVSLIICWVIHGRTVTQFYKCCKYAYFSVAGLSLITGIRLYIQSNLILPKRQQQEKQNQNKVFVISLDVNYYLPGFQELLRCDYRTFAFLLLHFCVIFINDVIMIYTTMWFSQPKGTKFAKHGQALITGLQYGSISLILYTIIDNLKISNKILKVFLITIIFFSLFTFYSYGNFSFLLFAILVAIMNQFYRHSVFNSQSEQNPIFERCIQIVERFQKLFILSMMPSIVMLVLQRDDIQDCLLWAPVMVVLGAIAFRWGKSGQAVQKQEENRKSRSVKVDKIE